MHHELKLSAGRNPFGRAFRKYIWRAAGKKRSQRPFLKTFQVRQVRQVRGTGVVHNGGIGADARQLAFAQ